MLLAVIGEQKYNLSSRFKLKQIKNVLLEFVVLRSEKEFNYSVGWGCPEVQPQ